MILSQMLVQPVILLTQHQLMEDPLFCLCLSCSLQSVVVAIASRSDMIQYYGGGIINNFADCCTTTDCQGDISHGGLHGFYVV
jgi:hypothetical protein